VKRWGFHDGRNHDVEYAKLLPVPLTTIHQPCREIGQAAMAMLDRIEHPNMLTRDILLDCKLVVRESCGAREQRKGA
jgi:GntR family transcriptional regulator, arabinose operon transcriptional repressor